MAQAGDGELPRRQLRCSARGARRTCSRSTASRAWSTTSATRPPATALAPLDADRRRARAGLRRGAEPSAARRRSQPTVRACRLPREPFLRLIEANRRDQRRDPLRVAATSCSATASCRPTRSGSSCSHVFGARDARRGSRCPTRLHRAAADRAPAGRRGGPGARPDLPARRGPRRFGCQRGGSARQLRRRRCARCSPSRSPAPARCSPRAHRCSRPCAAARARRGRLRRRRSRRPRRDRAADYDVLCRAAAAAGRAARSRLAGCGTIARARPVSAPGAAIESRARLPPLRGRSRAARPRTSTTASACCRRQAPRDVRRLRVRPARRRHRRRAPPRRRQLAGAATPAPRWSLAVATTAARTRGGCGVRSRGRRAGGRRRPLPAPARGARAADRGGRAGRARRPSYETFDELVLYCRRVAGPIGRLCVRDLRPSGRAAERATRGLADDLGVAMQLTNILRDVREDADARARLPARPRTCAASAGGSEPIAARRISAADRRAAARRGRRARSRFEADARRASGSPAGSSWSACSTAAAPPACWR